MTLAKLIYITFPNKESARSIGEILVKENLVACVNILGNIESLYKWEGEFNHNSEILVLAKTSQNLEEKAISKIKELHPYECPAIISFDVTGGNKDFLNFVNFISI